MKISELISKLEDLKKEAGDLEIEIEIETPYSSEACGYTAKLDDVFEDTDGKIILQGYYG